MPDITVQVRETEKLFLASILLGFDHAGTTLELSDEEWPQEFGFEEAEEYLKTRIPMNKKDWKNLESQVRFRAFTVAKLSTVDAIQSVRDKLLRAMQNGQGMAEWWDRLHADEAVGLSGAKPWYWETVYRTNIQTNYNAGRAMQFALTNPEYLEFIGIEDIRQTPICQDRTGTILPATHPFWKSNWPGLHHRCRSSVRAVTKAEMDIMGTKPTGLPENLTKPSKGFGRHPIDSGSFYKLTDQMKNRAAKYGFASKIQDFAGKLGLKDFQMPPDKAKKYRGMFAKITDPDLRQLADQTYKNAPADAKKVIKEYMKEVTCEYDLMSDKSAYSTALKRIVINDFYKSPFVFSHEFGHGVDLAKNAYSRKFIEFHRALRDDFDRIKSDLSAVLDAHMDWISIPETSDIINALTWGTVKGHYIHATSYWLIPGNREAEIMANLLSVRMTGRMELWKELQAVFPGLTDFVEGIMK